MLEAQEKGGQHVTKNKKVVTSTSSAWPEPGGLGMLDLVSNARKEQLSTSFSVHTTPATGVTLLSGRTTNITDKYGTGTSRDGGESGTSENQSSAKGQTARDKNIAKVATSTASDAHPKQKIVIQWSGVVRSMWKSSVEVGPSELIVFDERTKMWGQFTKGVFVKRTLNYGDALPHAQGTVITKHAAAALIANGLGGPISYLNKEYCLDGGDPQRLEEEDWVANINSSQNAWRLPRGSNIAPLPKEGVPDVDPRWVAVRSNVKLVPSSRKEEPISMVMERGIDPAYLNKCGGRVELLADYKIGRGLILAGGKKPADCLFSLLDENTAFPVLGKWRKDLVEGNVANILEVRDTIETLGAQPQTAHQEEGHVGGATALPIHDNVIPQTAELQMDTPAAESA